MRDELPRLRQEVLRDPRYRVHKIADRLLPYLRVIVEQFEPQRIILFGSYAYGNPEEDSDIDLLVVKKLQQSALKDAIAIRQAWGPVRKLSPSLAFDLLVVDEAQHRQRLEHAAGFYDYAVAHGVTLA